MRFIHALLITISFSTFLSLPAFVSADQLDEIQRLAEQGDVKSQSHLGYLYYAGEGVPQDYAEAVKWYSKAAAQGDRDAQYNLAVAYAFGEGVTQDLGKAATWYRRAAQQSHKIAQYSLGLSYIYGEGVPQDSQQAAHWFEKSALQGYSRAQVHLASMYHIGDGIEQNYKEATKWYRKAADRGDPTAQYNLGSLYRSGKGVEQNLAQAKRWFRMAADQNYAPAQNELASLSFKPVHKEQTKSATQSKQATVATSDKPVEEKQATPAIKTTNTPEEKTVASVRSEVTVTAEEATTSVKEEAVVAKTADEIQDSTPTIQKPVSSASDLIRPRTTANNENQIEEVKDTEKQGGIAGFFKNIFQSPPDEAPPEVAEKEISTVYLKQDQTSSSKPGDPATIVKEEAVVVPDSSPTIVQASKTIDEETIAENIISEEVPSEAIQQATPEKQAVAAEINQPVEQTYEAVTEPIEQTVEDEDKQKGQGVAGFFNKLFGEKNVNEGLANNSEKEISTVYLKQDQTSSSKPGDPATIIKEEAVVVPDSSPTIVQTSKTIDEEAIAENIISEEVPTEEVQQNMPEELPVIAEISPPDEQADEALTETSELTVTDEDKQKGQGIAGFFNRFFGSKKVEEESISGSEEESDTIYLEQDQLIASETNVHTDSNETTETVAVETSDSNIAIIQTTEPTQNLQPPPVTDIVINYEKQIKAGQAALLNEDFESALKHFKPAAVQGNSAAQSYLASMYYTGSGVQQDFTQAFKWYRRAAEQGDVTSQYSLGNMYLLGEGVEQDDRLAHGWYSMAAAQGHENAKSNVANLERSFAQEQALADRATTAEGLPYEDVMEVVDEEKSKTNNSLPGFIDKLFKPEKSTEKKEEIASSDKNSAEGTLAETESAIVPAKTETVITAAETESVATVYPLENFDEPGQKQDIVDIDESVSSETVQPEIDSSDTESPELAKSEEPEEQGELFNQLFNAEQEQAEVADKQEEIDSISQTETPANIENETATATEEDESKLLSFFNNMFNDNNADINTEKDAEPVDNKTGLIAQEPVETKVEVEVEVEVEKQASVDDFKTENADLKAIHSNAVQGNSHSQYELANLFYEGNGISQDYSQAFLWYRRSAQQGEKEAQYKLGNMYLMGEGVTQNDQEAMRWYEMAANQGHEAAQHNYENLEKMPVLAMIPEEADATPVNSNPFENAVPSSTQTESVTVENNQVDEVTLEEEASDETEKLAEEDKAGFFGSLKNALGFNKEKTQKEETAAEETVYINNNDEIIDEAPATKFESVKEIASTQEPEDQIIVESNQELNEPAMEIKVTTEESPNSENDYQQGLAYTYGDGVAVNYQKAFEHFHNAAQTGHVTAQYRVATAYAYGEGVEKNQEKAAEWYEKAATKGDPLAQRQLAMLYWAGKGVTKDKAMAHAWYSIIAGNGNTMDKQRLDHIQQEMTSEELSESKRIADSLK